MTGISLMNQDGSRHVALRGVQIWAELAGLGNKTKLEQTYVNQEAVDIEAVYTFPLPSEAAVCQFEVIAGDRVLRGVIEERDTAIDQYEEAVGQGHAAYQMEQIRPDVFQVRVGNLKPGQMITIRLTYIETVESVDGRIRLAFPTTLAPRYTTAAGMDPLEAAIDGDALNPPNAETVPYGLNFHLTVALGSPLRKVSSPSHELRVDSDLENTKIGLTSELTEMNRDLVIELEPESSPKPHAILTQESDGSGYVAMTWFPEFEDASPTEPEPTEYVFLIDCSGSMSGASIIQVRKALAQCLNQLRKGDLFNIWRFGSHFEQLAPEPLTYGDTSHEMALAYVRGMEADLGGTELYQPLRTILTFPSVLNGPRQILLLTDGQVSNEPALVALAKEQAQSNRIFTFGIGSASSQYLIKSLARATGGMAEFLTHEEPIDEKVVRTFCRIVSPTITNVQIDWQNAEIEMAQFSLPPVFDGDAFRVLGRYLGKPPKTVTLRCRTLVGERSWTLDLPEPQTSVDAIKLEWARQRIAELGDMAPNDRSLSKADRRRLIRLSKDFNLLCRLTSFVVVEKRPEGDRGTGEPVFRKVPVMYPSGQQGGQFFSSPTRGGGMQLNIGQQMKMGLQMKLAPRMIQSMEILQLPIMALQERIEQELSENVVLEARQRQTEITAETDKQMEIELARDKATGKEVDQKELISDNESDFERLLEMFSEWPEDKVSAGSSSTSNRISDDMDIAARPQSLYDSLIEQFGFFNCDREVREFGEFLIQNLDANGHLQSNLAEIVQVYGRPITMDQAQEALSMLQRCDPAGVGARDLKECMLLQIPPEAPYRDVMVTLISSHLEDLNQNRLPVIHRKTGYSIEMIKAAIEEMKHHINPYPGRGYVEQPVQRVTPDLSVDKDKDGNWTVTLLDEYTPELRISKRYVNMLRNNPDQQTKEYIKKKIDSAKWLIESIEQRHNTLKRVAQAIVDHQTDFLDKGPEFILPLKMQQIADKVGVHVTTVSRAVDDKWIQTPRGLFPLKRFFGSGTQTEEGGEVAWDIIRLKLKKIIDDEDKSNPLSDDALVEALANEGYQLARRTVTKYRKSMNIPAARQRKVY